MPNTQVRIGVPQVFLSVDTENAVPDLTTLVYSACDSSTDITDHLNNDANQPLLTTDTYQVMLGLVGVDRTNGGYTVNRCSPGSGLITLAASGRGIKVKVLNSAWPTFYDEAICAAIFLKTNAAKFQLAKFAFIDDAADFTTMLIAKPLRVAPKFATALLQSTTTDSILGNRLGKGVNYEEITPTTGNFDFRRPTSTVSVSPNNAPDFTVSVGRGTGISFQTLVNDIKTFVRAAAGIYVKYTDGTDIVEEASMSLNTAQAIIRGNRSVKVFLAPDNNGNQEIRLLIGMLTFNQEELTESWSKSATTPVTFTFNPASLDKLITNQHVEIDYLRRAA
jgi:hypothetical protein